MMIALDVMMMSNDDSHFTHPLRDVSESLSHAVLLYSP
jgi:hypothetical protein